MELINNLFQFAVTLLGFCLSGIWYLKDRKQTCFLLTCFYGCFALGSLYWTLYLLLFSETPQVFYVSEFGWIASVIFLYLLQYTLSSAEERDFSTRKSLTHKRPAVFQKTEADTASTKEAVPSHLQP